MIRTSYCYDLDGEIELEGRGTILRDDQGISTNQRLNGNNSSSSNSGSQDNPGSAAAGSNQATTSQPAKQR